MGGWVYVHVHTHLDCFLCAEPGTFDALPWPKLILPQILTQVVSSHESGYIQMPPPQ